MQKDQPYLKPLTSSSMASSYFAPLQQKQKITENSMEDFDQMKKEKISCLHSRLHQEADKISKWKTRVEMEMKQKDCKIQDANQTVESLRKSILELQLQNESLSLKLQEEISNRDEILQKIEATRTMCTLLKEYAAKLEDRMKQCETSRTELKYQEKEHLKSFELLSEQYKELQAVSVENYNNLTNEVKAEQEAKKAVEKKYKEQITDAERELKSLLQMTADKDKMIESITEKLGRNEEEINKLTKDRNMLQQRLHETSKLADSRLQDIAEKTDMVKTSREEKERLDAQLEEVSIKLKDLSVHNDKMVVNFNETEKLYAAKISKLQEDMASQQQSLEISAERIQALEADQRQNLQVTEELKSAKDMLQLDKVAMEKSIVNLMAEKDEVENELNNMQQQSKDLSSTATEKDKCLKELRVRISDQEDELSRARSTIAEVEQHLEQVKEQNMRLSTELIAARKESKKLEKQVQKLEKDKEEMLKEIAEVETEHKAVCCEKETIAQELEDAKETIDQQQAEIGEGKRSMEKMQAEKESLTKTSHSMLKEESKQVQVLAKQLESSKKESSDLDARVAALKQDLITKNKQIKELEKEAKATTKAGNVKDKKIVNLEGKLEDTKQALAEAQVVMGNLAAEKSKLAEETEKLKAEKTEAGEKVQLFEEKAKEAICEKDAAQRELENTTKQMAKTLDDYKLENDKVLQYRMERVEELKAEYEKKTQEVAKITNDCTENEETIKKLEMLVEESNQKLAEVEGTCKELKATCEDQRKAVDTFKEKENTISEEMTQLNSVIKAKEDEIDKLKKDVKAAKAGETAKRNKKVADLEAKNAELKAESGAKEKDIEQLKENEKEKQNKIEELNAEVLSKDQEIEDLKKQLALAESKKFIKEFSTPKIKPRSPEGVSVDHTPSFLSRLPKTPQSNVKHCESKTPSRCEPKTPTQSGIMRSSSGSSSCIPKRRKVVFSATPKSPSNNSDSDGMEVDIGEVQRRMSSGSGKISSTPLIRKSTPKIPTEEPETHGINVLKPKPRGPPVPITPKVRNTSASPLTTKPSPVQKPVPSVIATPSVRKTKTKKALTAEMEQFNKLFPPKASEEAKSTPGKAPVSQNVRATPSRAPGKFFKSRERQKLTKAGRTQKENDQSWVDLDAVFGFGLED